MAQVVVELSGDEARLFKSYQRVVEQAKKLDESQRTLKRSSEDSSKTATSGLDRMVGSLRNVALQYVGISQAIQAWNSYLEHNKRLARESSDATMTLAQSQAAVVKNLGDVSDVAAKTFLEKVQQVTSDLRLPSAAAVNMTASSVLSAVGGNQQTTLNVVRAAAPLFRDRPEDMAVFGGSMADVMKASGLDAKKTAALMLAIQGQARFTELAAFKEVAPALAAGDVVTRGDRERNVRETAALFAGIGSRAGDVEGNVTKTAVANLVVKLAKVAPDLDTTFERLAYARERPGLQKQLLKGGFRGPTVPIIQELLQGGDTQTSRMVQDSFEKMQASESAYDRKVSQLAGLTTQLALSSGAQASKGNLEQFLTTNKLAIDAEARRIRDETLDKTRRGVMLGDFQTWWTLAYSRLGGYGDTTVEKATNALRERRAGIAGRWEPGVFRGEVTEREMRGLGPEEREMVGLINRQLEVLEQLAAVQRNLAESPGKSLGNAAADLEAAAGNLKNATSVGRQRAGVAVQAE